MSVCSYLNSAAALLLEEDVLRLHVAVDDLVPVEQVQALQQRVRELAHQLKGGGGNSIGFGLKVLLFALLGGWLFRNTGYGIEGCTISLYPVSISSVIFYLC